MDKALTNKIVKIGLIAFAIFAIIYAIVNKSYERNEIRKYGTLADAKVLWLASTRGAWRVHVEYVYKGKGYENEFGTYDVDSLKKGVKIKVLISSRKPDGGPMRFLYVINQQIPIDTTVLGR